MEWLNVDEAVFYGAVWVVGFLASLFVTLGSASYKSARECAVLGGVSGFLAFACVSLFVGRISDPLSGHWFYLGAAALIGLSVNQQEAIRERLMKHFFATGSNARDNHNETQD